MIATPEDQRVLLDVADIDLRLARTEHVRTHPTQAARINELAGIRQEQLRELTALAGARDDIRTELTRIETDVSVAEQRRDRDAQRLAASTNAKDAVALEQEIASLTQRLSNLEDGQLEIMGRLEDADSVFAAQQALIDLTTAEGAALTAAAKESVADATIEAGQLGRDRAAVTKNLPADLLATYERLRVRGNAAGLLRRGTCEACRMVLSTTDINKIRQAADNAVLFCPECGCILVRTDESGLGPELPTD